MSVVREVLLGDVLPRLPLLGWWIIVVFAGFWFSILAHELGHLVAAKLVGAAAAQFAMYHKTPWVEFRVGETVYRLGLLPKLRAVFFPETKKELLDTRIGYTEEKTLKS